MFTRLLLLSMLTVNGFITQAQNSINAYEYWFDGNIQGKVTQPVQRTPALLLNTGISTGALAEGLHTLHLRFRDDSGRYSGSLSRFFYRKSPDAQPGAVLSGCQYWFNQDILHAGWIPLSGGSSQLFGQGLPTGTLSNGLHLLNIRFKDNNNQWSSTISQFFYKATAPGATPGNTMTAFQYWLNGQIDQAVTEQLSPGEQVQLLAALPLSGLANGLHQLQLRFRDASGQWSSTISRFFYKSEATGITTNVITGYRYWFNTEQQNSMVVHTTPPQTLITLNTTVDMGCLGSGNQQMHLQFRDQNGLWSIPHTNTVDVAVVTSNIHRFTGNGNWSNPANWQNNAVPALDLPGCKEIIIDHAAGGVCILDVPQYLLKNARLTVLTGKKLVIPQQLEIR